MPRYFFDIDDNDNRVEDTSGTILADRREARAQAIGILPNVAREILPDGDRHVFRVSVREEDGASIFQASLSLEAEWLMDPSAETTKT